MRTRGDGRARRGVALALIGAVPVVLAGCSSSPPTSTTTTTTTPRPTTTTTTTTLPPSTTTTTTTVPPAPTPATTLQGLGAPTIAAACPGASYTAATPANPLTTLGGPRFTSGIQLTGGSCTTAFTWHLNAAYASWSSFPLLDIADTGPELLAFASAGTPIPFSANGTIVNQVQVSAAGVHIAVGLVGVQSFSIVLPSPGPNPGSIDITAEKLVPR